MRFFICLFLIACSAAGVARSEFLLVLGTPTVSPGGRLEVTYFLTNDSAEERRFDLPARLTLRPRGRPEAPPLELEAIETQPTQIRLAPGEFHRAQYAGVLPEDLVGEIVLEPVDFEGSPLAFSTSASDSLPRGEPQQFADKDAASAPDLPDATAGPDGDIARFASAFSPYEPNYFAVGSRGPTNARFQISFKFRLFNPNTKTPFLEKLFVGYSQSSIWDLESTSKPFRDSSYRPNVFFLDDKVSQWPFKRSTLGFQGGLEHESNGRDDASSRSLNIAFVRPTLTFPLEGNYFISVSPKIYGYFEKQENPDIAAYRGYADLLMKIGETDGFQLASTLRKGTRSDAYSVQLDASYLLKRPTFGNLGGYLHLQYFNGYGESLIEYNQHVRPQFRIGLMITR